MSKRQLIELIRKSIHDWAAQYPKVELAYVEVYPSGIADNVHVIVVASKGFEKWESTDREDDLYWFLRKRLGDEKIVRIYLLRTLTEEQYDSYDVVRECIRPAAHGLSESSAHESSNSYENLHYGKLGIHDQAMIPRFPCDVSLFD